MRSARELQSTKVNISRGSNCASFSCRVKIKLFSPGLFYSKRLGFCSISRTLPCVSCWTFIFHLPEMQQGLVCHSFLPRNPNCHNCALTLKQNSTPQHRLVFIVRFAVTVYRGTWWRARFVTLRWNHVFKTHRFTFTEEYRSTLLACPRYRILLFFDKKRDVFVLPIHNLRSLVTRQTSDLSNIEGSPTTDVGRGSFPPWNLKCYIFYYIFGKQKRVVFLVLRRKNEILPLLAPCGKSFMATFWKIRYGHPRKNPSDVHESNVNRLGFTSNTRLGNCKRRWRS